MPRGYGLSEATKDGIWELRAQGLSDREIGRRLGLPRGTVSNHLARTDLHRRLVEAFNARDIEAWIALCDPGIEFHTMMGVGGAVYHGHDGVRRWHRDLEAAWGDELRIKPEAYFDLGEHTLAFNLLKGRGRHSGADVEMPYAQMARWRDGLMAYFKAYAHREDALRDLGVSEDALKPIAP